MKRYQKVIVSILVTASIVSILITPSFAAPDSSPLDKEIGNELVAKFNIQSSDIEDTVVLSWDAQASETDAQDYDGEQDKAINVDYFVSPGVNNDDDITVSVYLKLHEDEVSVLNKVSVGDGDELEVAFTEDNYSYYLLQKGIKVEAEGSSSAYDFDISFKVVSDESSPFTASLIAIQEESILLDAPSFSLKEYPYEDGRFTYLKYEMDQLDTTYLNSIESVWINTDLENYELVDENKYTIDVSTGSITLNGDILNFSKVDFLFKIKSDGYEDADFYFSIG